MEKIIVFALAFAGYISQTSVRYGWAYTKPQIHQATGLSMKQLGLVDFFYVGCYSFGFIILGSLLHKISLKSYVIIGIVVSCLSYLLYPLYYALSQEQGFLVLLICMSLNGFFQATIWPGIMGIFGNWFKSSSNGSTLLAFLAISGNIGNIYASNICNILEIGDVHWVYNFVATGAIGFAVTALMLFYLQEKPKNIENSLLASSLVDEEQKKQKNKPQKTDNDTSTQKYGVFSLLRFPKVPRYVAGFACLKGSVYGLVFWLPTYFYAKGEVLNSQKGFIISMYDLGFIMGAMVLGYFADRFNKRALFLSPMLFCGVILMLVVTFWLSQPWQYYIAMVFTGICIGGPYNNICTVITMDLGNVINEKESVAKVSSLIQGVASLCSAVSMVIIPLFSFEFTLYIFASECFVAVIVLFPLFLEEAKTIQFGRKLSAQQYLLKGEPRMYELDEVKIGKKDCK